MILCFWVPKSQVLMFQILGCCKTLCYTHSTLFCMLNTDSWRGFKVATQTHFGEVLIHSMPVYLVGSLFFRLNMSFEDFHVYGRDFYVNCTEVKQGLCHYLRSESLLNYVVTQLNSELFYLSLTEDFFAEDVSALKRVRKQFWERLPLQIWDYDSLLCDLEFRAVTTSGRCTVHTFDAKSSSRELT